MKVCGFCNCLVRRDASTCPFCDATLRDGAAPIAVGLAAALTACGPAVIDGNEDESGGSTSTSPPATTSVQTTAIPPMPPPGTTSTTSPPPETTTSTSGSSEATDITSFIENPDGGALYGLECTVWAQDCAEGDKCVPWANDGGMVWNARRCSAIADNPQAPGDPCTVMASPWSGVDDCDGTSMCFHADPETLDGICVSFCQGSENDPTCPLASQACAISNNGDLSLCLERCDPLGAGCPDEMSCTAIGEAFVCISPGTVDLAGDCEQPYDCATGLSCIDAAFADCEEACCTETCDPDSPSCSDVSQSCAPVDPAGVCSQP